jgi:hypothetical protein
MSAYMEGCGGCVDGGRRCVSVGCVCVCVVCVYVCVCARARVCVCVCVCVYIFLHHYHLSHAVTSDMTKEARKKNTNKTNCYIIPVKYSVQERKHIPVWKMV